MEHPVASVLSAPLTREERPSTATIVARRLLSHVLSGELAVGDRLPPERDLAAALDVGRSAVREATQALGLLGLLEVRPGAGTYVRATTSELLPRTLEWGLLLGDRGTRDLIETRIAVEVQIARLAAQRCTPADAEALATLIDRMRAAVPAGAQAVVEQGVAFHLALAEVARNQALAGLLGNLTELLRVWSQRLRAAGTPDDVMRLRIEQHEAVLDACRAGDPEAADAAMREHLRSSWERLEETLPTSSGA